MRKAMLVVLCCLWAADAAAQSSPRVSMYRRSDGGYVQPHFRSPPDGNRMNNWTSRGNSNPFTGRAGTADPYRAAGRPIWRPERAPR